MTPIYPEHYSIHLEPDLSRFLFSGRVEIRIRAEKSVEAIQLDASDLAVWSCRALIGEKEAECPFSVDTGRERLRVDLPSAAAGEINLRIDYMGRINDRMAGFYRSGYRSDGGQAHIAVTQFEESDARRAFPCFDHPEKKATFDVEFLLDEALSAISNESIAEERPAGPGRKLVRFRRTPRMSTYLLFFGIGAFEFIQDSGKPPIRVAATPSMTRYARYGMAFARKALEDCERAFGIPYPLSKMDLIAIPDFAFGAMENWGAITFRENLLLHYPGITSRAGEERICEVIAHEIVHQWFGNLVSPSDWKYLWLNESFATYTAYGILDRHHPDWEIWDRFLETQTLPALERDGLPDTVSIEIPGGEHVVINTSTAPIIYNKGGSVLRQIEGYLGREAFEEGLRRYLEAHQYACASSHHLWGALEAASRTPVTQIMKSWIEQPGHPLIEARRDGRRLQLTQRRFSFLPQDSDQKWIIPLTIRTFHEDGSSRRITALFEGESMELDVGTNVEAFKLNDGHSGFYRVHYAEAEDLSALAGMIRNGTLGARDRWGIQCDLYALVRCGQMAIEAYLDFLSHYGQEEAPLVVAGIAANLHQACIVLQGPAGERAASVGKALLERLLSRIGHEPGAGERPAVSRLRDQILWLAVLFGSEETRAFGAGKFSALMRGESVHPDILRSVLQVGAWAGGTEVFGWLLARMRASESEQERMNLLTALGCFSEPETIREALRCILEEVPDRNAFVPVGAMAGNPAAVPILWPWYREHVDQLEGLHPAIYERIIGAVVPVGGLDREEQVEAFFSEYLKGGKAADAVKLSLERLRVNARMRQRSQDQAARSG